jgi:hypothetical protein
MILKSKLYPKETKNAFFVFLEIVLRTVLEIVK